MKELKRSGWMYYGISENVETVASHSFGVAVLAWLLGKNEKINPEKLLKMALVHDLLEIETGDLTPRDTDENEKIRLELDALKEIESKTPIEFRGELLDILKEYLQGKTREAKIVKVCDRLDALLQAYHYFKNNKGSSLMLENFLRHAEEVCDKVECIDIIDHIKRGSGLRV